MEITQTFVATSTLINKTSWRTTEQMTSLNLGGFIHVVRSTLKKLGMNVTRRKASQLIPGIGAITGAAINAAWAADSLNAVKQYSRYIAVSSYYSNTSNP